MSGKKAQALARVAARQCIGRAYETRVAIIADAIQEGMRLCKVECEAAVDLAIRHGASERYAVYCADRIAALMGEQ